MNTTLNVSPHVLMDTVECETKAWARHCAGYTSTGDAIKAAAGSGFHLAMAAYFEPGYADVVAERRVATALAAFHASYDPHWTRLDPAKLEPAMAPSNMDRILRRWFEMHPPALLPWVRVVAVEEAWVSRRMTLADGTVVALIVRPDMVVEMPNGKYRWIDTKTTGWRIMDPGWQRQLKMSLQVQLYTDAMVQKYGEQAELGGYISAVELKQLPSDPTRKCATHKVPYAECGNEHAKMEFVECLTTAEKIEDALQEASVGAVRLRALKQVAMGADLRAAGVNKRGIATGGCRFCSFAEWCDSSNRNTKALEWQSNLVYEPWVVEDGKRPVPPLVESW